VIDGGRDRAPSTVFMIFSTASQADERREPERDSSTRFTSGSSRACAADSGTAVSPRLLFLDDDPQRAESFLSENPQAVWVETVTDCLSRLQENWDEVHLDHDLGGKTFVNMNQIDCGMEVIRWLCTEPRDHLRATRFFVHTHNSLAGLLMVLQMRSAGYHAEFRPFGVDPTMFLLHDDDEPLPNEDPSRKTSPRWPEPSILQRWFGRLKTCWTLSRRRTP
jgi:hypothetical protein